MRLILPFTAVLMLTTAPVAADIKGDMLDFWDRTGGGANFTGATAYEGQRAGIISGGSAFIRTQPRNTQIASLQLPSFRAGCGGIDVFGGAFSYVTADEMVATLEAIMAQSAAYFFKAALHSLTPMLGEIAGQLEEIQQFANDANIDSCETAQLIGQGMFDQVSSVATQSCKIFLSMSGGAADRLAAAKDCGAGGRTSQVLNALPDGSLKDSIGVDTNLVWSVIQKDAFLGDAGNELIAELFMTMTGTVIVPPRADDDSDGEIRVIPPIAWSANTVDAFISGGDLEVLRCDTSAECLNPTRQTVTIDADDAFGRLVADHLIAINDGFASDDALAADTVAVIQQTGQPLMEAIKTARQVDPTVAEAHINAIADFVALELALSYINMGVTAISALLEANSASLELFDEFQSSVRDTQAEFLQQRLAAYGAAEIAYAHLKNLNVTRAYASEISTSLWGPGGLQEGN